MINMVIWYDRLCNFEKIDINKSNETDDTAIICMRRIKWNENFNQTYFLWYWYFHLFFIIEGFTYIMKNKFLLGKSQIILVVIIIRSISDNIILYKINYTILKYDVYNENHLFNNNTKRSNKKKLIKAL